MFPFPSALLLNSGASAIHGPISFVGSGVYSDNTGIGSGRTFNFSSLLDTSGATPTIAANDVAIAVWCSHADGADLTIATPTGWTKRQDIYVNNGLDTNLGTFFKVLDGTETSATFDGSHAGSGSSGVAGAVFVFRGVDITTPFDVADQTASGTTTGRPNAAAITPSTPGSWIVVACASGGSTANYTNPGDLSTTTNQFKSAHASASNDAVAGIGIKTDWTSGSFDPAQWGGASNTSIFSWAAVTMALRSAS